MHILFLTPQLPYPPRQGTSIRNYHLIARGAAQNHTVDLLSFMGPGDELPANSPLHHHCRRIATVPQPERAVSARLGALLTSPLPDMALRLESPAMHHLVQAWLHDAHGPYDIVQIEGIELAQYARHINLRQTAFIFDEHNCEYLLQQRNAITDLREPRRWHAAAYSLVQWAKLRHYEAQICQRATAVVAVSQPDQAALHRIAPKAAVHVAPNGIDLTAYSQETERKPLVVTPREPRRFTLLFTGKMDYRPNIDAVLWFAKEVLPQIVSAVPEIRFQIVGMNPHARLNALGQHPNIEITGAVSDVVPYLHAANVYIIPMRVGGGTRFKALEAMASSKAIVSTGLGVEGIGTQTEKEMLIADSPDEFAVAILRLIADQRAEGALSQQLGQNAYAFVAAYYVWERIIPVFERLYKQLRPGSNTPRQPTPTVPRVRGTHHDQTGVNP